MCGGSLEHIAVGHVHIADNVFQLGRPAEIPVADKGDERKKKVNGYNMCPKREE